MLGDPLIATGVAFIVFCILLLIGTKIAVALLIASIVSFFVYKGTPGTTAIIPFSTLNNFVLTAIPLYIFMGEILARTGASENVYRGASKLLSWVPGRLFHSNIVACALFASISGSSPATAATVGTVAIPSMKTRGYDTRLTLGTLAAGGTLGILIPPSITMIIYGMLSQTSVGALFAGGILPGLMLSVLFMVYVGIRIALEPHLAPKVSTLNAREVVSSLIDFWPVAIVAVIVLGGIFGGIFTPTEAAAIGTCVSLIIGIALRKLTWSGLIDIIKSTVDTTCMLLFIVMGAFVFAGLLAQTGTSKLLFAYVQSLGLSNISILIFIYLLYLFLGCFIDPGSMMIITLPTMLPILLSRGIDLVWFGILAVVLSEIGMITPPVGLNLFVIQSISGEDLDKVVSGSIPFVILMLIFIAVLTTFPSIILWLPSLIFR